MKGIDFTFTIGTEETKKCNDKTLQQGNKMVWLKKKTPWNFSGYIFEKDYFFGGNTIFKTSESSKLAKYGQEISNKK